MEIKKRRRKSDKEEKIEKREAKKTTSKVPNTAGPNTSPAVLQLNRFLGHSTQENFGD